jgi:8-oxo-dGTP diphosphatase
MRFGDIDWGRWEPRERATLLFVVRGGQVLLIRKKRGLGAGKVNGPGGRIEPGETPLQCAVREVREELLVAPTGAEQAGTLRFQFVGGFSTSVRVFRASGCDGEPQETDEALPLWTRADGVPYGEMWADDAVWLPAVLAGGRVDGRFLLDGDRLLGWEVSTTSELAAGTA